MSHLTNLDPLAKIDALRLQANQTESIQQKASLGQFFTPAAVARLMAGMFDAEFEEIRLLDPGAGMGTLTVAFVQEYCSRLKKPKRIVATLFEIDQRLSPYLSQSVRLCHEMCSDAGIEFSAEVCLEDFLDAAEELLCGALFSRNLNMSHFNCSILNPPYRKIHSDSLEKRKLKSIGIDTTNLYTGFFSAVIKLLGTSGELVAITPRSFCNGEYFLPFRKLLLEETAIKRIHLFDSRRRAFNEDGVLQENVILNALKDYARPSSVVVSSTEDAQDELISSHEIRYSDIIDPNDRKQFIHIPTTATNQEFSTLVKGLQFTLSELGLSVSTGPVVDFRLKEDLLADRAAGSVPLLYPVHLVSGEVVWPRESRKPNAIRVSESSQSWLVPNGNYVLVKRFSSKEENKRVIAAVYTGSLPFDIIGLENHLNYYHENGRPLTLSLANGLAAFLNSTVVDQYFRQFNGHTQVNASDLRSLKYPSRDELTALGEEVGREFNQKDIDESISNLLQRLRMQKKNPVQTLERIAEAEEILKSLGLPKEQQNERSALTLLALLDLKPAEPWSNAQNPPRGITPIMEFIAKHYGKTYAPNTRETIRRFTVHQMVDAGLLVPNPDKPNRPINSPDWVYQVSAAALDVLKTFGSSTWSAQLETYLSSAGTLKMRYAREREMARIPIEIETGKVVELSPGGQNYLVEMIWHEFAPRFTPKAKLVYLGDTGEKFAYFDKEYLAKLGVTIDQHGKIPDVILHYRERNWLVLVEAVTSHGPINPKRRAELRTVFAGSTAGLVFVTAFLDKKAFTKYATDISWESEVWVAESPSHLIHFDGERFLGPYPE
jgi:adenine-specific DNA-methyltransferase